MRKKFILMSREKSIITDNIVFWGLCATLIFLPLPFGSVEKWSIFAFEAATLVLFTVYWVGRNFFSNNKSRHEDVRRVPLLFKVFLSVFMGVAVIQLIPLPHFLLKFLSPQTYKIYKSIPVEGLDVLGNNGWNTLSFAPNLSLHELIKYVCLLLFGFLVLRCVKSKKDIEVFVVVMIASAVFQSFYGLIELFGGSGRIFGYENRWNAGSAFGTYINRDHFSGFLEMVFPLCIGYLLAKADFFFMRKDFSLKEKIVWFSQERLQKSIILGSISVLIGLGIFFSRSRSGISIFFITIFLMFIAISAAGGRKSEINTRKKRYRRIIRTVALVILFSVLLIGIKPIIKRFSWERLTRESRPIYYKNTIDLIKSFPLWGTGPGTYVYAYPMFEKVDSSGILSHAHNDYLEVLAESGIGGGGCLILLAILAVGYLFLRWMRRSDYLVKGIVLGCTAGIVSLLIHSLSDFNLRIPANAVYFVTLYMLGLSAVNLKRGKWIIEFEHQSRD